MFSLAKLLQNTKVLLNPSFAASFQSANFASTKSVEEKLGYPLKPKRPLTPFFRYLLSARPNIVAQNPKIAAVDIVRQISKTWPTVDEGLKKKLTEEYLKDRAEYTKQLAVYESKLTDDQRVGIKAAKEERADDKEKRAHKKKLRENHKPKKPATGYIRYQLEMQPTRGDMNRHDFIRKIATAWNELPEAKRKPYNDAYAADAVKYKDELAKWEKEMIKLGNVDLVRKSAAIDTAEPKPRRKSRTSSD